EPVSWLQLYSNVKTFLQNASTKNMANMLSAQLLTTEFNVLLGKVDPTASIFVPAVTIPGTFLTLSPTLQNSLISNGVTDPAGIGSVQDFLDASILELAAAPLTKTASSDRTFEEALKACLDAINNNETIFIPS